MLMKRITAALLLTLMGVSAMAQSSADQAEYLEKSWKQVATQMPDAWYASPQALHVADNVMLAQKEVGGWFKNKPYHHELTEAEKAELAEHKGDPGSTFDNGATIMEMRFLARVYAAQKLEPLANAFAKGLDYIFLSQYECGGWPQFYPVRTGKSVAYSGHITYNDNSMVNILKLLNDVAEADDEMAHLPLSDEVRAQARERFNRGIDCILKTQIVVDGQPTVWCAQHDAETFLPANARKFELASFSGAESVGIVQLLMDIDRPSAAVVAAVDGAVKWFEAHKIEGIRLDKQKDEQGRKNLVVVSDPAAPALWARFYDLETGKPFFCDRDGIKKNSLAEIGHERRNGYGWYTDTPAKVLKKYPEWRAKKVK